MPSLGDVLHEAEGEEDRVLFSRDTVTDASCAIRPLRRRFGARYAYATSHESLLQVINQETGSDYLAAWSGGVPLARLLRCVELWQRAGEPSAPRG